MGHSEDTAPSELRSFYAALAELEARLGGLISLDTCTSRDLAGALGVYLIFENGETRSGSGTGPRVVRVGTHGLGAGSKGTLWDRLSQHRGSASGGNQRGSILRRHIGAALMEAGAIAAVPGWRAGSTAVPEQRAAERDAEAAVSRAIGEMRFLWLRVDDPAGPDSERGYIERNSIALLSGPAARALDPPSARWLGRHASAPEIRESGLWNVQHVGEAVDPAFLDRLWARVRQAP